MNPKLIQIQNLAWRGILQDIELTLSEKSFTVVIGRNGAGKSSLFRCISGWHSDFKGEITLRGKALKTIQPLEKAETIAYLPQRLQLSEKVLVSEWLSLARYRFQEPKYISTQQVKTCLSNYRLSHLEHRRWPELSGGEAQRISLLSLRLQESTVWMLDEPANHLDPNVQQQVYNDIVSAWRESRSILMSTHNINLVLQSLPSSELKHVQIIGMENGRIQFTCSAADPDLATHVGELYNLNCIEHEVADSKQLFFKAKL